MGREERREDGEKRNSGSSARKTNPGQKPSVDGTLTFLLHSAVDTWRVLQPNAPLNKTNGSWLTYVLGGNREQEERRGRKREQGDMISMVRGSFSGAGGNLCGEDSLCFMFEGFEGWTVIATVKYLLQFVLTVLIS